MKNDIDKQSKDILSELAGSISENRITNSKKRTNKNVDDNKNTKLTYNNDETHSSDEVTEIEKISDRKLKKDKKVITANDLKVKKGLQSLNERKKLLGILKTLFVLQLIFMNIVILLIVGWVVLNIDCFKETNIENLNAIIDLTKYYITAVLVELLAGIIFIVHSVFKDKTIEQLNNDN